MTAHSRRAHATPSPRLFAARLFRQGALRLWRRLALVHVAVIQLFGERIPAAAAAIYGPRGLRFLLNVATALLVLSLPIAAANATLATAPPTDTTDTTEGEGLASIASVPSEDAALRAHTAARGLVGSRSVVTVAAQDVRPVEQYAVKRGDTLSEIAERFAIPTDDLAYANKIEDEGATLSVGQTLVIPPGRGALYFVKEGDTVAGVAEKFKVEPSVIMTYNRLYFEPQFFAPDQLIFVPGAEVPAMKRATVARSIPTPGAGALPARTGRLSWPVNGVITQYFWSGHTGIDIAAPYGTPIGASDDGVVVATGWVPVGGLRVCVAHADGLQTCYYHTGAVLVTPGQPVKRGQAIATIGMTGVTTGPHVHWELKVRGVLTNPFSY